MNHQTIAFILLAPPPKPSSRKITMGMPLHLHEVITGRNNLVNKLGADDKPKGNTAN